VPSGVPVVFVCVYWSLRFFQRDPQSHRARIGPKNFQGSHSAAPPCLIARSGHSMHIGSANDLARGGAMVLEIQHAGGWKGQRQVIHYTE